MPLLFYFNEFIMYKENVKYKLTGYRPVGIDYNVPREEIAEFRKGNWFREGSKKRLTNFVIEVATEI